MQKPTPKSLINPWVLKVRRIFEFTILLTVLGDVFFDVPYLPALGIISAGLLFLTYLLIGFLKVDSTRSTAKESFIYKLFHLSAAMLIGGIVYIVATWPGDPTIVYASMGTTITVLILALPYLKTGSQLITPGFISKSFLFLLLSLTIIILHNQMKDVPANIGGKPNFSISL